MAVKARQEWYQNAPKCEICAQKGKSTLATRASIERGEPRCFRHDPRYKPKQKYRRPRAPRPKKPLLKTGKRIDVMPDELVEAYELVINDKEYTSLQELIATNEARMRQQVEMIKESPKSSVPFIQHITQIIRNGRKNIRGYRKTHEQILLEVEEAVRGAVEPVNVWLEYDRIAEAQRKLVETETRVLNALGWSPQTVTALVHEIAGITARLEAEGILNGANLFDRLSKSPLFTGVLRLAPTEEMSAASTPLQLAALEAAATVDCIDVTPRKVSVDTDELEANLEFLEEE